MFDAEDAGDGAGCGFGGESLSVCAEQDGGDGRAVGERGCWRQRPPNWSA